MNFGNAIKQARRAQGLSQEALGESVGLPQSVIARIEGGADIKVSTLQRVLSGLSVSLQLSQNIEQLFLKPPAGSAIAAARDFGVDLGQLYASYRCTPEQRLSNAEANSRGLAELMS
jgi:transcriptional regulator with XRE-family HTH domain